MLSILAPPSVLLPREWQQAWGNGRRAPEKWWRSPSLCFPWAPFHLLSHLFSNDPFFLSFLSTLSEPFTTPSCNASLPIPSVSLSGDSLGIHKLSCPKAEDALEKSRVAQSCSGAWSGAGTRTLEQLVTIPTGCLLDTTTSPSGIAFSLGAPTPGGPVCYRILCLRFTSSGKEMLKGT